MKKDRPKPDYDHWAHQRDVELTHGTKVKTVTDVLRRDILSGSYPPGSELPGQNRLAELYGLSVNSIREAIGVLVHEQLLVRERGKGTYIADSLPTPDVVLHVAMDHIFQRSVYHPEALLRMLHGIMDRSHELGLMAVLSQMPENKHELLTAGAGDVAPKKIGVLLRSGGSGKDVYELRSAGIPCIDIGQTDRGPVPVVTFDRRLTAEMACEHMIGLGYRRIAHLGSTYQSHEELLRSQGFLETVMKHGLDLPAGYVVKSEKTFPEVARAVEALINLNPVPEAICCSTDRMAAMALQTLREKEIQVPNDVALMSFTHCSHADQESVPLSGVYLPFYEMGGRAVEELKDILQGADEPEDIVFVPPRLMIRQSCGAGSVTIPHTFDRESRIGHQRTTIASPRDTPGPDGDQAVNRKGD